MGDGESTTDNPARLVCRPARGSAVRLRAAWILTGVKLTRSPSCSTLIGGRWLAVDTDQVVTCLPLDPVLE